MKLLSTNKTKIKFEDLHFFHSFQPHSDGSTYVYQVAVGPDRTLWICSREMDVPEPLWDKLYLWPVQALVFHPRQRCWYINTHIYAKTCPDPKTRRRLLTIFDELLDKLCKQLKNKKPSRVIPANSQRAYPV